MLRVGASSGLDLSLQKNLVEAGTRLQTALTRLATARRINQGSDDPAGLIAAEQIRAELAAIDAADRNAGRAAAVVAVADGGLSQVGELLNQVQGHIVAAAGGFSEAETAAAQIEVDAALEAINRIGGSTALGDQQLFSGSGDLEFALSTNLSRTDSVELPVIQTAQLGGGDGTLSDLASGGSASLAGGDLSASASIVDAARSQVNEARARLGAFASQTITSAREVLAASTVQLSEAVSLISDADMALEAANLVQSQLLQNAGIASVRIAGERLQRTSFLLESV